MQMRRSANHREWRRIHSSEGEPRPSSFIRRTFRLSFPANLRTTDRGSSYVAALRKKLEESATSRLLKVDPRNSQTPRNSPSENFVAAARTVASICSYELCIRGISELLDVALAKENGSVSIDQRINRRSVIKTCRNEPGMHLQFTASHQFQAVH